MKKFWISLVLALLGSYINAQTIPQTIGTKNTAVETLGNHRVDSVLDPPKRRPSPSRMRDTGSIYYSIPDSSYYTWNGSAWVKRISASSVVDWCSIRDNGADPTGNVGASSTIQNLINSGCKTVFAPAGIWLLDNTVLMKDSVTIIGDSRGTFFKLTKNIPGFRCNGSSGRNCTFLNIHFLGTNTGFADSTSQTGIIIDTATGVLVQNVTAYKLAGWAVRVRKQTVGTYPYPAIKGNIISNCLFDQCYNGIMVDTTGEFTKINGTSISACTNIGLFIAGGNIVVNDCVIGKNGTGIYMTGGSNNSHGVITGCTIPHNAFYGLYITGATNGFNFANNTIRNNAINYIENSDQLWFTNNEMGIDSFISVNNTNMVLQNNKFWLPSTGRPGPPDSLTTWRIVGDTPTISGSGYVKKGFSLYDVGSNKRFDMKHTNGVVNFTVPSGGKYIFSDTLSVNKFITGSSSAGDSLTIIPNLSTTPGKIFFGSSFTSTQYRMSTDTWAMGITHNNNPTADIHIERSGLAAIFLRNTAAGSGNGTRLLLQNDIGSQAQMLLMSSTGSFLTNGLVISTTGAGGIGICSQSSGPIYFSKSTTVSGSNVLMTLLTSNGNFGIGASLTNPTAKLHLTGGTATAGTAPLKITAGTNLATPEDGAIEYDGTDYYATVSTTRYTIPKSLAGSATLDFPSTNAQNSSDLTITVTGAADGDIVELGVPNAATLTNSSFTAWVSASNTVTVRFNNYSSGAQNPASGTFKVRVIK